MRGALVLCALLGVAPAARALDCVEGTPAPRAPLNPADRPANGLPTLGTMLVAGGAGTLAGGLFLGALGTFAAFERAPQDQVAPYVILAVTVGSSVVLLGTLMMAGGMLLYWWGWSLIAPPPDTRPRCPPKKG